MENNDLYDTIVSDKLTWEGLIRDIIRDEGMNPWDIDIVLLARRFYNEISKLKEVNLRLSGKFILAASILLKMKSDLLLNDDKEIDEGIISLDWLFKNIDYEIGPSELIPRIPMMKKRKVTLDELIDALRKAMEVKDRRHNRVLEREELRVIPLRTSQVSITEKINNVYTALNKLFKGLKKKEVLFHELVPSNSRDDVLWTFIPLIHLCNKGDVDLFQDKCFGDIIVRRGA